MGGPVDNEELSAVLASKQDSHGKEEQDTQQKQEIRNSVRGRTYHLSILATDAVKGVISEVAPLAYLCCVAVKAVKSVHAVRYATKMVPYYLWVTTSVPIKEVVLKIEKKLDIIDQM
ncbi:anion-transporting ATPase [Striga asiatica]|uniref:Anion-transporting ATPase n=1 Tax=Striga asiatica TaxID=4170 RepID=A0A5A7R547_STRAF|nr:anion-transporting ATPase [Striga asiatica]